jgi:chorismate mutase
MHKVRGIRGAITVTSNSAVDMLEATKELIDTMIDRNQIEADDVCSVFATVTHDLDATFPALAIRQLQDWSYVPIMCALEIDVTNSLPMCIRLMVLINTEKPQRDMIHVYLRDAAKLRPDLASSSLSSTV